MKLAKKIADTKKLKTEFSNRAKEFYEGLMSGDAEYYDARYGGGSIFTKVGKKGVDFLGKSISLQNVCNGIDKTTIVFSSKVAKEFNIIAFYDDKKLGELGKKIFRQKTVDAWKSLVQRWDPVGTKKTGAVHYVQLQKNSLKKV